MLGYAALSLSHFQGFWRLTNVQRRSGNLVLASLWSPTSLKLRYGYSLAGGSSCTPTSSYESVFQYLEQGITAKLAVDPHTSGKESTQEASYHTSVCVACRSGRRVAPSGRLGRAGHLPCGWIKWQQGFVEMRPQNSCNDVSQLWRSDEGDARIQEDNGGLLRK